MAASISPILCPFCSSAAAQQVHADAIAVSLGMLPSEQRAFQRLWNGRGQWVPRQRLLDAIYAEDIDGGPDEIRALDSMIYKTMRGIRNRLGATVYRVESRTGSGGLWRVVIPGGGHDG
jgi:DNA-binding response OmpR family regulator